MADGLDTYLTRRQADVLRLHLAGNSLRRIGIKLNINPSTARDHLAAALTKARAHHAPAPTTRIHTHRVIDFATGERWEVDITVPADTTDLEAGAILLTNYIKNDPNARVTPLAA